MGQVKKMGHYKKSLALFPVKVSNFIHNGLKLASVKKEGFFFLPILHLFNTNK